MLIVYFNVPNSINRIFIYRVFAGALFLTINRLMHYYASVAPCAARYTVVCLCVCMCRVLQLLNDKGSACKQEFL